MNKGTKIVLRVGAIILAAFAAIFIVEGVAFATLGSGVIHEALKEGIINGSIRTSFDTTDPEKAAVSIELTFTILGYAFLGVGTLCVPASIFGFITAARPSRERYIACIVLGALSFVPVCLIGGIMGLVSIHREQQSDPETV